MRHVLLGLVVFVLLAVQAPLLHVLDLTGWAVDVGLVTVLYLSATSSRLAGFVTSVVVGLIVDAFTPGGILGMNTEIMGIMFLVGLGLSARFQLLRTLPLVVVAFVCALMKSLLFFLFSILFDRNFSQYEAVLLWSVPHALVAAVFAPFLFLLLGLLDRGSAGRRARGGALLR